MSWILAFCGFAALIILHEFGHFLAAKAVGMRVEKFSLFFGPMLAKVTRGETTYGIGPIPLGGYVKISGMNPHEELPPEAAHRAYYRQPVWKRIVVIAAGPAVNLLIAFLIIWGLLVFRGAAVDNTPKVGVVESGLPAAAVLRQGDTIVAVDGKRDVDEMSHQISSHHCPATPTPGCKASTPAKITVERDGHERTIEVTPVYDAQLKRTRIGFSFEPRYEPQPAGAAATDSGQVMWRVTRLTGEAIGKVFYDSEARKEVSGVVGSYEATRQSFELSTERALEILALISLSLAVINLFPFLPLDGGHIFWALAEKVRGRPIPFAVMERAGIVGFALVGILFFIGLTNDIGRLTGEGFDIR
jgi:regulator of sigma E protease